jgi:hypothetical protein
MMTKVTRIVLLALLLQITTAGHLAGLAQTRHQSRLRRNFKKS